jgi:signal transduction histidine kinase
MLPAASKRTSALNEQHVTSHFLSSAGVTGRNIADHDWSRHPLGPIGAWPSLLRTMLSTILSSGFPSYIIWGEEQFVFYNDAYMPILGEKLAMGQGVPLGELWSEIRDEACAIAEQALRGENAYFEDRPFAIERYGRPESAYFTFSYSPIRDQSGCVGGVLCMIFETTDKVLALMRSKESEDRLQLSLDASGNIGTWSVEPETSHTTVDARFARLFQVDAALAQTGTLLERFTNMIHPGDRERVLAAIAQSIDAGDTYDIEYRIPQLSGKDVWVNARGKMFENEIGKKRFAGVAVDITERKKIDDELRRLAADLTESNQRKTEFLATLAHELRNPLAPMRTGLELMRIGHANPETLTRVRDMMGRQLNLMTSLIDDLMDISRINSGKVVLEREKLELKSVIASAVETCLPTIEKSQHELVMHLPEDSLRIDVDARRLTQVLCNLLTNAAKYTPPGGRIEISAQGDDDSVEISVKDNGSGIPTEALSTVFDMFHQVGRNMQNSQGGLGIGLSLVRRLVELHGGSVTASSAGAGQGSTFTLRLPLTSTGIGVG